MAKPRKEVKLLAAARGLDAMLQLVEVRWGERQHDGTRTDATSTTLDELTASRRNVIKVSRMAAKSRHVWSLNPRNAERWLMTDVQDLGSFANGVAYQRYGYSLDRVQATAGGDLQALTLMLKGAAHPNGWPAVGHVPPYQIETIGELMTATRTIFDAAFGFNGEPHLPAKLPFSSIFGGGENNPEFDPIKHLNEERDRHE